MTFETKFNWDETWSPVRDKDMVRREMRVDATSRSEFREKSGSDYMEYVCHQLWDQPQLNFDGTVWDCCRNNWKAFDGNVFEDGLEAALNSEQMQYARRMLTDAVEARADVPCTTCSVYKNMRKEGRTSRPCQCRRLAERLGSSPQQLNQTCKQRLLSIDPVRRPGVRHRPG